MKIKFSNFSFLLVYRSIQINKYDFFVCKLPISKNSNLGYVHSGTNIRNNAANKMKSSGNKPYFTFEQKYSVYRQTACQKFSITRKNVEESLSFQRLVKLRGSLNLCKSCR